MEHALIETQDLHDCWNQIGVRGDQSCVKLREHVHCRNCEVYAAAAGRILRRTLPSGYKQDWARHFAEPEVHTIQTDRSGLVFRIGVEWLALPSKLFATVAAHVSAHRLPHRSGTSLAGIVNVAGRLYPCMSLANLLSIDNVDITARESRQAYPRLLLMQWQEHAFALPVDEVHGVSRYASESLHAPPTTTNKGLQRYLTGVLSLDEMRIACLDHELVGHSLARALR